MTLITPELVASQTENLLNSVVESICELRHELEGLKQRARAGEEINTPGNSRTVASVTSLLDTCQKVENRLAECRNKSVGIAQGSYALDLDKARADIGCKLDRLRCARNPERISE